MATHLWWQTGGVPDSDVMSAAAALHRSVVQHKAGRVFLVREEEPARKHPINLEEGVMRTAAGMLMLASYRNQCVHVFVRPAMLATAICVTKSTQRDELFAFFCFLRDVFSNEFIFVPESSSQDFEEACNLLQRRGALRVSRQEVTASDSGSEVLTFLQKLLRPFIDSYQVMLRHLCDEETNVFPEKKFQPAVRKLATDLLLSGELDTFEGLSSDMQKNVLSALCRLQAVTKSRASGQSEYRVDRAAVRSIADALSGKIPPQMLQTTPAARL